jgi:hypothetical protein
MVYCLAIGPKATGTSQATMDWSLWIVSQNKSSCLLSWFILGISHSDRELTNIERLT